MGEVIVKPNHTSATHILFQENDELFNMCPTPNHVNNYFANFGPR